MVTGTGAADITGTEMVTGQFRRHAAAGRRDTGTRVRVDITGAKAGGTGKTSIKSRSNGRDFSLLTFMYGTVFFHFLIMIKQAVIVRKLCKAIQERRLVQFYYESKTSDKKDWRTVEPYLVGIRKQDGHMVLSGWFIPTDEQLNDKQRAMQKLYLIDRIDKDAITVLPATFSRLKVESNKIYDTPTLEILCRVEF
jgi:hypothetical protein